MKFTKVISLSAITLLLSACSSDDIKVTNAKLINDNEVKICFDKSYDEYNLMLAMVITTNEGKTIDRKWHDEFSSILQTPMSDDTKCYKTSYFNYLHVGNSTPKHIAKIATSLENTQVQKVEISVATSTGTGWRKKPDQIIYKETITHET